MLDPDGAGSARATLLISDPAPQSTDLVVNAICERRGSRGGDPLELGGDPRRLHRGQGRLRLFVVDLGGTLAAFSVAVLVARQGTELTGAFGPVGACRSRC